MFMNSTEFLVAALSNFRLCMSRSHSLTEEFISQPSLWAYTPSPKFSEVAQESVRFLVRKGCYSKRSLTFWRFCPSVFRHKDADDSNHGFSKVLIILGILPRNFPLDTRLARDPVQIRYAIDDHPARVRHTNDSRNVIPCHKKFHNY